MLSSPAYFCVEDAEAEPGPEEKEEGVQNG